MKLGLPPKLVEKTSLGASYFVFPDTHLMPYYAKMGRSRPLIAFA
jgi:hypothetical protein